MSKRRQNRGFTREQQLKGVRAALASPRTPPQLKAGLRKRLAQLEGRSTETNSSRHLGSDKKPCRKKNAVAARFGALKKGSTFAFQNAPVSKWIKVGPKRAVRVSDGATLSALKTGDRVQSVKWNPPAIRKSQMVTFHAFDGKDYPAQITRIHRGLATIQYSVYIPSDDKYREVTANIPSKEWGRLMPRHNPKGHGAGTVFPRFRRHTLRSRSGRKVRSRKMATAILLSKLRREGRIPPRTNPIGKPGLKKVAGEWLPPKAFAYVGDIKRKETWKLPLHFKSLQKTLKHIRNALSRYGHTVLPAHVLPIVKAKIIAAAEKYGVEHRVLNVSRGNHRGLRNRRRTNSGGGGQRRRKRNAETATELYTEFHGRGPSNVLTVEDLSAHPELAKMGDLVHLETKTETGEKLPITWKERKPLVVAEPTGSQIYFVGGDQKLYPEELHRAGIDTTKDLWDLGECRKIEYDTEKGFDNFEPSIYVHPFGKRGQQRPRLQYDKALHRLLLVGGIYRIKPEGIVD